MGITGYKDYLIVYEREHSPRAWHIYRLGYDAKKREHTFELCATSRTLKGAKSTIDYNIIYSPLDWKER